MKSTCDQKDLYDDREDAQDSKYVESFYRAVENDLFLTGQGLIAISICWYQPLTSVPAA